MKHNRKIIYLAGFLFSVPVALTSYINSSFLETYINKNYVGIIYVIASIITVWGLLKMPKILTRFGNTLTIFLFCLLIFLSLILLALGSNSFIVVFAFILYFISINFVIASLDIFIEDFSKNSAIGSLRGFYLMIINFAWVIAQMISGSIIAKSSFQGIYLFSSIFMILVLLIFILFLRNFKDPEYKKVSILKTIRSFIQNKHISKIYFINLILKFFYSWMVIYTPIYLHEYLNFNWNEIGIIFSIMLLPFILLDFPLGKLSDKIGEKKMLIAGFVIIILSVLVIPFIYASIFWLWALVLFMTRVGAATIEVMSESYFFKVINKKSAPMKSVFSETLYRFLMLLLLFWLFLFFLLFPLSNIFSLF